MESSTLLFLGLAVLLPSTTFGSFEPPRETGLMDKYNVVNIYSTCEKSKIPTYVNTEALLQRDVYMPELELFHLMYMDPKTFNHNDICNDTKALLEILVDLHLSEEYFFEPETSVGGRVWKHQNILRILAIVPNEMSRLIEEFFSFTKIMTICGPTRACNKGGWTNTPQDHALQLQNILEHFKWHDVTFLHFYSQHYYDTESDYFSRYFNQNYELLKSTKKYCLKRKAFHFHSRMDYSDYLVVGKEVQEKIIPFFKEGIGQSTVIIFMGFHQLFGYVFDHLTEYLFEKHSTNPIILPYAPNMNHHRTDLDWIINFHDNRGGGNNKYADIITRTQQAVLDKRQYLELSLQDSLEQGMNEVLPFIGHSYVLPIYIQFPVSLDIYSLFKAQANQTKIFLRDAKLREVKCVPKNCQPGFTQIYSSKQTNLFDEENGFKCIQCPVNHYKPLYGNGRCITCDVEPFTLDDGKRTACMDRYTDIDIYFNDVQTYVLLASGSICLFMTLVILIILIHKHDTPTVRSSDKTLPMLHLLRILLTIYLNLVQRSTNVVKCIIANLIISVLYVINVGFVYTKSQKLLTAFRSTVRLSRSEIRKTSAEQIFIVILFLIISNLIAMVTFTQQKPGIASWENKTKLLRIHYCNTGFHENVLISFITFLQMFCFLQAYRGRHLPGPMNNAMSLVYAILIVTVNFLITFPIVYFLDQTAREFARLIVLVINCTIIVSLLYGYKCYIMVFKPRKNTREYFNRKRMEAMSNYTVLPHMRR